MGGGSKSVLPKPFGDELPQAELRRVFLLIRKNSPQLNLFNGTEDLGKDLLSFIVDPRSGLELVVNSFQQRFADVGSNPLLLVRGQYFEAGLHHRVSFHATLKARIDFEASPACLLRIHHPVRRVSSLFIAYPSDEKPLFLEIPVAGAPPDVRVVEFSMGKLKAYSPGIDRLLPSTKYLKDVRLQFVDLGETMVSGSARKTGKDEISIELSPMSGAAHTMASSYLESTFTKEYPPEIPEEADAEPAQGQGNGEPSSTTEMAEKKPGPVARLALVIIESQKDQRRITGILEELGWTVQALRTYDAISRLTSFGHHKLVVLDVRQGEDHAVDFLRRCIRDEILTELRFAILGEQAYDVREPDWSGLGQGTFLRRGLPDKWIKTKLERWLKPVGEAREAEQDPAQPLVLVVDDDDQLRNSIGTLLMDQKYRVITAENGIEGVRSIRNLHPDLVLLDLEMPGRTGLEVLKTVRSFSAFRKLPVIIVSGRRDQTALSEALQLGITDYVVKPFNGFALLQRVKAALAESAV